MKQLSVKILENKKVAAHAYRMRFLAPMIAKTAKPGQFIMVRVMDGFQPLLRKPFGVHSVKDSSIDILYEVIGEGTKLLAQKKPGEYLDIIGPIGNGFDLASGPHILVAGGMGVAPLIFLAERLRKVKSKKAKVKNLVLLGARTKSHVLCEKEFKKLGCDVKIATDDGSSGHKGYVTDLLKDAAKRWGHSAGTTRKSREVSPQGVPIIVYACGPRMMLREISRISDRYEMPTQVSLEEHMSCGFGACLGCVVSTTDGYKRVCKEGPVFDARQIIW